MKRSEHRILTTHVGSLPRPPALRDLLVRQDRGEAVDGGALAREAEAAVRYVISRQLDAGVDVGNDGEQPRVGFSTYPARRMRGFGGASKRRMSRDMAEHPDYMARLARQRSGAARINDAPRRWPRWPIPTSARPRPNASSSSARRPGRARGSPSRS